MFGCQYYFVNFTMFFRGARLQKYIKTQKRWGSRRLARFVSTSTESLNERLFAALRRSGSKGKRSFRSCTSIRTLWKPSNRRRFSFAKPGRKSHWLEHAFVPASRDYPCSAWDVRWQVCILCQQDRWQLWSCNRQGWHWKRLDRARKFIQLPRKHSTCYGYLNLTM